MTLRFAHPERRGRTDIASHSQLLDAIWTRLRLLVRVDEVWLAGLIVSIGTLAGCGVVLMNSATGFMHAELFGLPRDQGLSASSHLAFARCATVPALGGAFLGLTTWLLARFRPGRIVDPIEANALYGGRMSLRDSVIVAAQTVWSNGVGGSVGLEAGYAQLGAGIASWLGRVLRLRRAELRLLVGCGAAAAIAGAFSAPLCGAFYGIELVIGTYSIYTLSFVMIASLFGAVTANLLHAGPGPFAVALPSVIPATIYPIAGILGLAAGFAAIGIMRGVTSIEAAFRKSKIPAGLRPVLGGLAVGAVGCVTPVALGSGHSALHLDIAQSCPLLLACGFFLLKAVASAVSIGAGFRGGLFFASLLLGAFFGKIFADILAYVPFLPALPIGFYALVGMSALAVGIIGGPMTMTLLALESTNNLSITIAVLGAAMASAFTVRQVFGYSFATWRFHLRGEAIRSGADIGWMRTLTVGRMMRVAEKLFSASTPLAGFCQEMPLGGVPRVVLTNADGGYAGIAYTAEAHAQNAEGIVLVDILHHPDDFLLPEMNVREALVVFESTAAEALAVLNDPDSRQVIGLLTEKYALRRYNEELEHRRRELLGE